MDTEQSERSIVKLSRRKTVVKLASGEEIEYDSDKEDRELFFMSRKQIIVNEEGVQ